MEIVKSLNKMLIPVT